MYLFWLIKPFGQEFYIIIMLLRIYTEVILDYDALCSSWLQTTLERSLHFCVLANCIVYISGFQIKNSNFLLKSLTQKFYRYILCI
jgi:hypothetical protein